MTSKRNKNRPRHRVERGEKRSNFSPKPEPPGDRPRGEKSAEFFPTGQPAEGEFKADDNPATQNPHAVLDHLRVWRDKVSNEDSQKKETEPARRGRPVIFDEVAKARVLGLITAGVSQRTAAVYLGIDHTTISKAIKSDPDFARDVEQAQAAARVHPLLKIHKLADNRFEAARYLYEKVQPRTDLSDEREAAAARAAEAAWKKRVEDFHRGVDSTLASHQGKYDGAFVDEIAAPNKDDEATPKPPSDK